jgi:DNA repair exonuclease SbcCD ATPase subunit
LREYEKTISDLIAEKEGDKDKMEGDVTNAISEKAQAIEDLHNVEAAFADVHRKYERTKQVVDGFKKNEEQLKKCVDEYKDKLKKQDQKYNMLKAHAEEKLEEANREIDKIARSQDAEKAKLTAMLQKTEMKARNLERTLGQKTKENEELKKLPTEKENLNEMKGVSKTSPNSDTTGLATAEVKDMFTLLKEIPQAFEKEEIPEKQTESDEVKIEAGVLTLIIHKASQLENLDIVGKSDPFVKIKFNGLEFKSNSVRNTLEPEWNFSNDLIISENQNENIEIIVYDSDIGRDSIQGSYSLPLLEAMKSDNDGSWYNLNGCKSGKIFIFF